MKGSNMSEDRAFKHFTTCIMSNYPGAHAYSPVQPHHWHEDEGVPCILQSADLDAADGHQVPTPWCGVTCQAVVEVYSRKSSGWDGWNRKRLQSGW